MIINIINRIKTISRLNRFIKPDIYRKRKEFFYSHDNMDFWNIPIFIISYNRLTYLKSLVNKLKEMGYKNINIIDNDSTYEPLIDYYEEAECKVFRMSKNFGHMVFWECDLFSSYRNDLYVVTDPDILPVEECPDDFIKKMYKCLKRYPRLKKVGLSLKIDDIPDEATLHDDIIKWEKKFYKIRVPFMKYYVADVDTTMALYIPDKLDISDGFLIAVRLGKPYQARHLPWYKIKEDISNEDRNYAVTRETGFWDETEGKLRVNTDVF